MNDNTIIWDDTEILNAFHKSVLSHKTKKSEEVSKKRKKPDEFSCNVKVDSAPCHFDTVAEYERSVTKQQLIMENPTEAALSSMLMSWYQSGYATGRYHTLLELQAKGCANCNRISVDDCPQSIDITPPGPGPGPVHAPAVVSSSVCNDLEEGEI